MIDGRVRFRTNIRTDPHRLRAIMYYRKFEIADPLEQELLAVGEPQEGVPALVEALSEQGFHITDEDALSLVKAILERLRDEDGNSLLVKGFDVQTREDGSRWLRQYRFESLGVSLEMENEDDWEITREKIGPVWRSARSSSDVSDITIPNTVSEIGQTSCAYCRGIRRVVIPEGVREIGLMAFLSCKDLEEVVLPASLTKIEAGSFAGCVNLRSIRLPEGLETVASLAFCGCDALERIVLPNTVSELGYGAFAHCLALTEVHVPADLAIPVEKHVFYGCTRLGSVRPQLRLGNLQTNDHEVLYELETAVWIYATLYLDDVNLVHNFVIQDIDEHDPSLIGSRVPDEELEEDIRYYFNHSNWIVFDDRVDIKALREREGTEFMQTIVVDTFRSLGVEVFSDTERGLDYYEEKSSCIELISLRFLFFGDEWYVMTFEWSD